MTLSSLPKIYVGVDVSKAHLDVFIAPLGQQFTITNDPHGHKALRRQLWALKPSGIVMEATGRYHRALHACLEKAQLPAYVINPYRARKFADAKGVLAKTDAIDARTLALLAASADSLELRSTPVCTASRQQLRALVVARRQRMAMRVQSANHTEAEDHPLVVEQARTVCALLDQQIQSLDEAIQALLRQDAALTASFHILLSVKGVGYVTAVTLLADLPELGSYPAKALGSLAGVVPFNRDSGIWRGKRSIYGGRRSVRSALYMSALACTRWNPDLSAFYKRLRDKGKPPKVALTAVMRKLLCLLHTLVKQNRLWSPHYA